MVKWLLSLLVISIAVGGVVAHGLWQRYAAFKSQALVTQPAGVTYLLQPGATVGALADDWVSRGWIARPEYLKLLARESGLANRLQAGEYHLPAGVNAVQALEIFAAGKVIDHTLTITPGKRFADLLAAVRAHPQLRNTLRGQSDAQVMAAIGKPGEHPEGRFFPDTYHFPRGATDVALLRRAYRALETRLQHWWRRRAAESPLATPYQALILASIVEKETGAPDERPRIAGVFVRRLLKGMRLQTDPTVIYGLGDAFDGNLRRRDLRRDTPYNTYTRGGLPPTPIALVGEAAMQAVVQPTMGDALYFVAKGDGTHAFSATLAQHNAAVRKYQLRRTQ